MVELTPEPQHLAAGLTVGQAGAGPAYEIVPGEIVVNPQALLLVARPDVYVLEFDMDSKYVDAPVTWSDGTDVGVLLRAGEQTLNRDESTTAPTDIRFLLPGWSVLAETARYTLRVVLFVRPDECRVVGPASG